MSTILPLKIVLPTPWFESVGLLSFGSVALLVSLFELVGHNRLGWLCSLLSGVGLAASIVVVSGLWLTGSPVSYGVLTFDRFGYFVALILLATGGLIAFVSGRSRAWLFLSLAGALLAIHARELVTAYLGIELATLPLIAWSGLKGGEIHAQEANLKYFLLAALASVFLLYGIALLYAATGATTLEGLRAAVLPGAEGKGLLFAIGALFVFAGLAFKIGWVPFHFYQSDVAQGAPIPAAGAMIVIPKIAGIALFLRLLTVWGEGSAVSWREIFWGAALGSLVVGHLQALPQTNMKRLLAYGSIGHAGFLLVGLAAAMGVGLEKAYASILFYLIAYALMMVGTLSVMVAIERRGGASDERADYAGLAARHPWLAAAMALFLLSLAGVPATIGFAAKFYLLAAALEAGLYFLVVVAVVTSLIAATCYLEVIVAMYFKKREAPPLSPLAHPLLVVLLLCFLGVLYWGLFPGNLLLITGESIRSLVF